MALDILETQFTFPETVYIIGTGETIKQGVKRIPHDAFTIVVNKAVDLKRIPRHIWLCGDGTLIDKPWFNENAKHYISKMNHIFDTEPTPVFSTGTLYDNYPGVPYFYTHGTSLTKPPWGCMKGVLRGGCTIAAQAAQLAYWKGAKRIVLAGVDMRKRAYWDDPTGKGCKAVTRDDGVWALTPYFNIFINWLKEKKIQVQSLTPTALDVEVI